MRRLYGTGLSSSISATFTKSDLRVHAADLAVHDGPILVFTMLRSSCSRWADPRVHDGPTHADPEFRPKVARICDLYLEPPPGATVVCVDEKTCIQALERKHPGRPAAPGRHGRREFEYIRHGTRALIAGFDVRTGQIFGQLRSRRTASDLDEFMDGLARRYPRGLVYVVWDNLNIHHGEAWERFNARLGGRFHFVYTPKHASWVNQVEIWFGILHRRILKHGDFATAAAMVERVEAFIRHWNQVEAHPFHWTFRGRFQEHDSRQAA